MTKLITDFSLIELNPEFDEGANAINVKSSVPNLRSGISLTPAGSAAVGLNIYNTDSLTDYGFAGLYIHPTMEDTLVLGSRSVGNGILPTKLASALEIKTDVATVKTLNLELLKLSPPAADPVYAAGNIYWNSADSTVNIETGTGGSTLQVGLEQYIRVANVTGSTILNGRIVYITGSSAGRPTIELAKADDISTSDAIGVTTHDILADPGTEGFVTTYGVVHDLDTSAWPSGTKLYLSPTTAGLLTSTLPSSPDVVVTVGTVVDQHATAGSIYVSCSLITQFADSVRINSGQGVVEMNNLQDAFRHSWSTGVTDGCDIISNGDGTVNISAGEIVIRVSDIDDAELISLVIPAQNNIAMTANDVTYLYISYNSGSPIWQITDSIYAFNGLSKVISFVVGRNGNTLNIVDLRKINVDSSRKNRRQKFESDGYVYKGWYRSAIATSSPGETALSPTVGPGRYYLLDNPIEHLQFDCTIAGTNPLNVFKYFYNRSGWQQLTDLKVLNNTQYDNAGTLTTLTNNKWRVDWWYVVMCNLTPYLALVMGDTQYNSSIEAFSSPIPPTPPHFDGIGVLVGKSIIQKSAITATVLAINPENNLIASSVTDHNALSSIQGGGISEYYHLTSTEYTGTGTGAFVRAGSPTITGTLTVADLIVNGTTTTVNSTTLDIADINITLAKGAPSAAFANGGGITIEGANATILYASADDSWNLNKKLNLGSSLTVTGAGAFASGSVSAPSLYLSTDTTTGLYRIGANNLGVTVSGAKVLDIASVGLGITGNLTMSGSARRILGDLSHATHGDRLLFQSSTVDGNTQVGAIPNGTATQSVFNAYNNSDTVNTSIAQLVANSTGVSVRASRLGAGAYLPVSLWTNDTEKFTVGADATGTFTFGGTTPRLISNFVVGGTALQTSSTNAGTSVVLIPNGTSSTAQLQCQNSSSDLTNYSYALFRVDGTTASIYSDKMGSGTYLPLTLYVGGSERFKIETSGIIKYSATSVENSSTTDYCPQHLLINSGDTPGSAAYSVLRRSRAGTTAVASGDTLGTFMFSGHDGTGWDTSAYITGVVDGVVTTGTVPTSITFNTGPTTPIERMRVDSAGNVGIGLQPTASVGALQVSGTVHATSYLYVGDASTSHSGGITNLSNTSRSIALESDPTNVGASSLLLFKVDGTERVRIDSSGNVGVGITAAAKLHINTSSTTAYGLISQTAVVGLTTGNYVNMAYFTDSRSTNHDGLRIVNVRDSTGSGAGNWETASYRIRRSVDQNDGSTGVQEEIVFGNNTLAFHTNAVQRLHVGSTGTVTVGVKGTAGILRLEAMDGTNEGGELHFGGASTNTDTSIDNHSGHVRVGVNSGIAMIASSTGDVGIGSTVPTLAKFTISNKSATVVANNALLAVGNNDTNFRLLCKCGVSTAGAQVVAGIGLDYTTTYIDLATIKFWRTSGAGGELSFLTGSVANGTERMRIDATGNVGIGMTPTASFKLEVSGAFAATTKSFVIKHPTKPNKRLVYGSLEGPENGVYVRGKTYVSIIELPEYWTKLVDPESITVQLTAFGNNQKLYVEKIENNRVHIRNDNILNKEISCFYFIQGERVDVAKLEVEPNV